MGAELFTTNELIRHKVMTSEHMYCDICKVDCKDWDDFVKHKVQSDKHISCPSCGQDYKSTGGLERHIRTVSTTLMDERPLTYS
jgi:transposase-like protein